MPSTEPAAESRRTGTGAGKERRQRDLARPARDIEVGAAEGAARRQIERERAGERNPDARELGKLGSDGGEPRRVECGERERGAAHLALPMMEQLHLQTGLDIPHLQVGRQVAEDRCVVHVEGEVGARCRPGEAGGLVMEGEGGIAEADALQPRQRMILVGRIEQIGDQGFGGAVVRTGAVSASGERHPPFCVAQEAEAQPQELDRGGCDDSAQQGRAAHPERRLRHLRQGAAVRGGDPHAGQPHLECTIPAGPDEEGVVELDPIGEILALEGFLDIGRQESQGERAARQPPRPEGENDGERGEQGHRAPGERFGPSISCR